MSPVQRSGSVRRPWARDLPRESPLVLLGAPAPLPAEVAAVGLPIGSMLTDTQADGLPPLPARVPALPARTSRSSGGAGRGMGSLRERSYEMVTARSASGIVGASLVWWVLLAPPCASQGQRPDEAAGGSAIERLLAGQFAWRAGPPLISHPESTTDTYLSIKDPSVVYYEGRWHLFCSVIRDGAPYQTEYLSFGDWDSVADAERHVLTMHQGGRFGAPQVFYFAPHGKWYLICQAMHDTWDPQYAAAYATTSDIADPDSWSPLKPLGARSADGKPGLDFWIICDDQKAYLFFTTLDGCMWREETSLGSFP
ncbi:MAG: hypothetical protein FJX75_28525, partial [Armatimonadetes bacterium]|nr:hypothetical protein [Armatimonadota bacterium]